METTNINSTNRRRLARAGQYGVVIALTLGLTGCSSHADARPTDPVVDADRTQSMDQYAWSHRPFVVFASDAKDPRLLEQRRRIDAKRPGFDERSMAQVEVVGADANTKSLRERYSVGDAAFAVVLVGKDTGAKARWSSPVALAEVFAVIDVMPMRRNEIRDKKRR